MRDKAGKQSEQLYKGHQEKRLRRPDQEKPQHEDEVDAQRKQTPAHAKKKAENRNRFALSFPV